MSREHELFGLLRDARKERAQAQAEEEDARLQLAGRVKNRRKVDMLIEDLLDEVQTGTRKDTLTAYIEARGGTREEEEEEKGKGKREKGKEEGDVETADEHQRGPTAPPPPEPVAWKSYAVHKYDPKSKGKRGRRLGEISEYTREEAMEAAEASPLWKDQGRPLVIVLHPEQPIPPADPSAEADLARDWEPAAESEPADCDTIGRKIPRPWTAADLEEELESACYPPGGPKPTPWKAYRDMGGITDAQIEAVLRQLWGSGGLAFAGHDPGSRHPGHTTRGGARPAFWVGARHQKDQPPDLSGRPLVDKVREVLDMPYFELADEPGIGIGELGGGEKPPIPTPQIPDPTFSTMSSSDRQAAADIPPHASTPGCGPRPPRRRKAVAQ